VDVGIHLGAAVFEKGTHILKVREDCGAILGEGSVRGCREAGTDVRGVLMQNKNREDVTEKHANEDEANPTE